jgi:hypothetical protein
VIYSSIGKDHLSVSFRPAWQDWISKTEKHSHISESIQQISRDTDDVDEIVKN